MKFLLVTVLVFLILMTSSGNSFAQDFNKLFIKDRILELGKNESSQNFPSLYLNRVEDLVKPVKYRIPILMYHYIGARNDPGDATKSALSTWPQVLENQIKTLKEAGFTFLTNQRLSEIIDENSSLPEKPIVLTFDDGYKDFYSSAYPILKKYNASSTVFVISGFLNHPNHLSPAEVIELSNDDTVEIGAHTVHHAWLKDQEKSLDEFEVSQNKKDLENLIKREVVSFAYPYGAFDEQAIEIVISSGFKSAVSTIPGIEQSNLNQFFMYRLRPGERQGQALIDWLSQDKFTDF